MYKKFIEELIVIRKKKFSQKQIAELMGKSQSDISAVESGRRNITLKFLFEYASKIGAEISLNVVEIKAKEKVMEYSLKKGPSDGSK